MNLEVVSEDRDHHSEASVKFSSRSNTRNPVKTPPILQFSSWILAGHGGSWWTLRWCQMIGIILQKLLRKFHQDLTSGTLSRLHLSSKPLLGVLEDLEVVLDDRYHPSEASAKVSSRFNIRNPVKTPPVLQVSSWSFGGHWGSLWTWRRCQMIGIILQKLLWKLHHYPSS